MHDRGIIKWAPFNSVINGKHLLREIHEEKSRIIRPTLSEEQVQVLEETIMEKYNSKTCVEVYFYQYEHIYKIRGIITSIHIPTKKIIINNTKTIVFANIIKII